MVYMKRDTVHHPCAVSLSLTLFAIPVFQTFTTTQQVLSTRAGFIRAVAHRADNPPPESPQTFAPKELRSASFFLYLVADDGGS